LRKINLKGLLQLIKIEIALLDLIGFAEINLKGLLQFIKIEIALLDLIGFVSASLKVKPIRSFTIY
jgi:hypothetical protein